MNKRYLHHECPDSICSPFIFTYSEKLGWLFSSSNSAGIQLGNTRSCSASSREDGEGQESERVRRNTDAALGRLCTSHTENMHTRNEGFCFLALFFASFFFFYYKNHIIPPKASCAKVISRTTIQSDSVPADKLPIDPFLTSILL